MRSGPIGGQFHKWNKYYDAGLARSTPNIKGGERMAISASFCNGGLRISRSPAPVVNRMASHVAKPPYAPQQESPASHPKLGHHGKTTEVRKTLLRRRLNSLEELAAGMMAGTAA